MEVETVDWRVEVEGPTPAVSILGRAAGATVSQEACLVSDPGSHVLAVSSWAGGFVLDPR